MKNIGIERHIIRGVACTSAFLALIGTGFGAWVFTQDTDGSVLRAPVEVDAAINFTQFQLEMDGTLSIDEAGTSFNACSIEITTQVDVIKGLILTDNGTDGYNTNDSKGISQIDLKYTIVCNMDAKLNEYIYCKKIGGELKTSDVTNDTTLSGKEHLSATSPVFNVTSTTVDTSADHSGIEGSANVDYTFPIVFDWQPNMHPKSTTQFSAMLDKLNAITVEHPVSFQVSLKPAESTVSYY